MKTNALKGIIIPLFITTVCSIFLVTNSALAQNNQTKKITNVRVEQAQVVNPGNEANKLTDDQKAKIKDMRIEHMKSIQTLKAQNAELTAHLKTLNIAEKPDNKAIFKTIDEITALRGDIMKRNITFEQSIKSLLTPEQIKALEMRRMNGRFAMGGRNQNFGQQGNRNSGRGQMGGGQMGRGGMRPQGQMMQRGQMGQGGMSPQGQMMQRGQMGQGGAMRPQGQMMQRGQMGQGGGQMMPQGQVQKRFQIIRQGQPNVSDTTKTKNKN